MGVVRTDQWLVKAYDHPLRICKKLATYFSKASAEELHTYLGLHGMYQKPTDNGTQLLDSFQRKEVWKLVHQEFKTLRSAWHGPNIPIFILPSNQESRYLRMHHGGKSGLAFSDKLFLFLSEYNTEKEIQALFTHEYNHVCRLAHDEKNEADYTLLDAVILEGLAENAVRERHGKEATAPWTTYYTNSQLERMCKRLILPNKDILKTSTRYEEIMYGFQFYPKMAGYSVGYYLVDRYRKKKNATSSSLLPLPSISIAQIEANQLR
ncbi:DUF2268 domain-containing protein [Virgibacillus sp. W0430]|uniref:DUF2268 domain-containing protein n=1 Tax=Virgibacillus sp. W0430 TaxID=3391580 RepID=UPI003F4593C2